MTSLPHRQITTTNNQQSPALNSTLHHHGQSSNLNDCQTREPLADSGARKCEVVAIKTNDVDLGKNCIKVMGKGNKEGYLIFGEATKAHLLRYLEENSPIDTLFDLDTEGLKTMLRRLQVRTGIKCNAHSFRRGFATELRRKGLSELDIAELGRWSSTEMVQRYSKAYTFQDAATRYKAIVR